MKNLKIFLLALFLFFLISCQKDESYAPIVLSATIQHASEFGAKDGIIDLEVTGGAPPFTFLWSNSCVTEDLNNVAAGNYSVIVNDQEDQTASDTFEITQPAPDTLTVVFHTTHPSETGAFDGAIEVEIAGGYSPFSFLWSTGSTSQNLQDLAADFYILVVNDSRGQTLTDSVQLYDLVTDIDLNSYSMVKIGDQTWMGENLRVRHTADGSSIESYAYNNDTTYEQKYGRLYTWDVAMNGSTEEGAQGICPGGWHIPGDDEFKQLEMYLGMSQSVADLANTWRGSPVGTRLKAGGDSGYNAQMAGRMVYNGSFGYLEEWEYMWTSTEYSSSAAWRRCLANRYSSVGRYNSFTKSYGFSVRCIKDED